MRLMRGNLDSASSVFYLELQTPLMEPSRKSDLGTKTVRILGTHGIPGRYSGFETAAENISRYLLKRGWRVIVYCQRLGAGPIEFDTWEGIERVIIPVTKTGWIGTSLFDWKAIQHAIGFNDACLTFGYNTGVFNTLQRLKGIPNVINMDGMEWMRARWGWTKQTILFVNERIAARIGDHLIADHPEIERYLSSFADPRKISVIAYGAVEPAAPKEEAIAPFGLKPNAYMTLIARQIPENSILEIVRGFCAAPRGIRLAVIGPFEPSKNAYHRSVREAANEEVTFLGPQFDPHIVGSLRHFCRGYLHGHTVGGTNPSLVEAMAANNPIIAQDNPYNRWVAQDAATYFNTSDDISQAVELILGEPGRAKEMGARGYARFRAEFTWEHIGSLYEQVLLDVLSKIRDART